MGFTDQAADAFKRRNDEQAAAAEAHRLRKENEALKHARHWWAFNIGTGDPMFYLPKMLYNSHGDKPAYPIIAVVDELYSIFGR